MKFSNYFIFLFSFLFLVASMGIISAQPPSQEVGDIDILYSKISSLEFQKPHTFIFSVENNSKVLDGSEANCTFSMVSRDGDLIHNQTVTETNSQWIVSLNSNNFTNLGEHSILFQCNTGNQAGSLSFPLTVTADGNEEKTFPTQFLFILLAIFFVAMSYFDDRLALFRYSGSILLMVMGILTLYPGYSFINHSNLLGLSLGSILVALGFYFLIEDVFSRKRQASNYNEGHNDFYEEDDDLFR